MSNKQIVFELFQSIGVLSIDNEILFEELYALGLIVLHTAGMIWIQPRDKDVIPDGVDVIRGKDFLRSVNDIKYLNPLVRGTNRYVTNKHLAAQ
jgi:hypothetical protein